jgi:hypothetical protein
MRQATVPLSFCRRWPGRQAYTFPLRGETSSRALTHSYRNVLIHLNRRSFSTGFPRFEEEQRSTGSASNGQAKKSEQRRHAKTDPRSRPHRTPGSRKALKNGFRNGVIFVLALVTLGGIWGGTGGKVGLSETKFTDFNIVTREDVSPTAFVLTLRCPDGQSKAVGLQLDSAWKHGVWHVQMKEPRVQIAREYTPLPPIPGSDRPSDELRFLIRKLDGGEMSTYLSSLGVGDKIGIRGPFYGFDATKRLGHAKEVVFLAGGTGVAPALQVASKMLDRTEYGHEEDKPSIRILWANRRSTDREEGNNSLGLLIKDLKARHGQYFQMRYFVDEERRFINMHDVKAAMSDPIPSASRRSQLATLPTADQSCHWHSSRLLTAIAEEDDTNAKRGSSSIPCSCSQSGASGRNLLFVSGSEGFIKAFAGPKHLHGGREMQGAVGGLLEYMKLRNPSCLDNWLVLKL